MEVETAAVVKTRMVKVTPRALEDRLQLATNLHKAKLAKLTGTVKQVHQLMEHEGESSLTEAQQLMEDFSRLFGEFCDLNKNVREQLRYLSKRI